MLLVPTFVPDGYVNTRFYLRQSGGPITQARKVSQQRHPRVRDDPFVAFFLAHHVPVAEKSHRNPRLCDVKEAIEKFGPLRDVLGAILAVYADHEVCQQPLSQILPLTNKISGIRRYWEQS